MVERLLTLKTMVEATVYIFNDFPINTSSESSEFSRQLRLFRERLVDVVKQCNNVNKYIFVLNSDIYSSYYVLAESSVTHNLAKLSNVAVVKMVGYGNREMQEIINQFSQDYPIYKVGK